jgi:hypothetical protein
MAKPIFARIHDEVHSRLVRRAAESEQSIKEILNKALHQYLETADEGVVTELKRSIGTVVANQKSIKLELEMLGEMFSFFILQWFCTAPVIPDAQKPVIFANAKLRHDKFLEQLQKRLVGGGKGLKDVLKKEKVAEDDNAA